MSVIPLLLTSSREACGPRFPRSAINLARFLCKKALSNPSNPNRHLHFAGFSHNQRKRKNILSKFSRNSLNKSTSSEKFEEHFAGPGFFATVMVKRKEVGISGSSKKKRGFHIRDPKLFS
ncbi:hypothetical protein OROHE_012425 [Orobanche hederae]